MSGGDSITFERLHRSVERRPRVPAFIRTAIPGVDAPATDRLLRRGLHGRTHGSRGRRSSSTAGAARLQCYRLRAGELDKVHSTCSEESRLS